MIWEAAWAFTFYYHEKISCLWRRLELGRARGGIHWPAAICFSSIFFRLRRGSILALNAREAPVEEEDKMFRRESASFVRSAVAVAHSVFNYAALERVAYQAVSSFNVSHYRDMELTLLISPNKNDQTSWTNYETQLHLIHFTERFVCKYSDLQIEILFLKSQFVRVFAVCVYKFINQLSGSLYLARLDAIAQQHSD